MEWRHKLDKLVHLTVWGRRTGSIVSEGERLLDWILLVKVLYKLEKNLILKIFTLGYWWRKGQ